MVDITIYNRYNAIAVDHNYPTHVYHEHGTISGNPYINIITLSDPIPIDNAPIVLCKPQADAYITPYGLLPNASGTAYDRVMVTTSTGTTIDWIVYRSIATEPADVGIEIITGDDIYFTTSSGYVNLRESIIYTGYNEAITVDDADDYYGIIGGAYKYTVEDNVVSRYMRGIKRVSDNSIYVDLYVYTTASGSGSGGSSGSRAPVALIAVKPPPFLQ